MSPRPQKMALQVPQGRPVGVRIHQGTLNLGVHGLVREESPVVPTLSSRFREGDQTILARAEFLGRETDKRCQPESRWLNSLLSRYFRASSAAWERLPVNGPPQELPRSFCVNYSDIGIK